MRRKILENPRRKDRDWAKDLVWIGARRSRLLLVRVDDTEKLVERIRQEERLAFAEEIIAYLDTSEAQAWVDDNGRNDALRALAVPAANEKGA